jgi:hypothetical protein
MKRRRSFMSQDTQQQQQQQQEQQQSGYTLTMVAHLVASHFPRDVAASMRAVCTELAFDERILATAANTQTCTGHTLLSAVCGHGNAERVARLLANENVFPDVAGNAALMAAASSESIEHCCMSIQTEIRFWFLIVFFRHEWKQWFDNACSRCRRTPRFNK